MQICMYFNVTYMLYTLPVAALLLRVCLVVAVRLWCSRCTLATQSLRFESPLGRCTFIVLAKHVQAQADSRFHSEQVRSTGYPAAAGVPPCSIVNRCLGSVHKVTPDVELGSGDRL